MRSLAIFLASIELFEVDSLCFQERATRERDRTREARRRKFCSVVLVARHRMLVAALHMEPFLAIASAVLQLDLQVDYMTPFVTERFELRSSMTSICFLVFTTASL